MRNKWKVSRYDFTLVEKGWPRGEPSGGKGMRGMPKTQDQKCWTNDGGSTEDQAVGTSKTVLSRFFRILLPIRHCSGKGKPRKKRYVSHRPCVDR